MLINELSFVHGGMFDHKHDPLIKSPKLHYDSSSYILKLSMQYTG